MANAYAVSDGALDAPSPPAGSGVLSRLLAEAFGTFVLVLGVLSISVYNFLNATGAVGVALTAGFAYAAALIAVGHVSGGWFNPAITLAQAIAGRVTWAEVPLYWIAQLVGGFAAGAVVFATLPDKLHELIGKDNAAGLFVDAANGWGDHSPLYTLSQGGATFNMLQTGIVEVVVSAVLAGIALAVGTRNRAMMAAGGGFGLAALTITAYPVAGAGMNPVRSSVAAVFAQDWGGVSGQVWMFWLAPLVGAGIAALFAVAFGSQGAPVEVDVYGAQPAADASDDEDDDEDDVDDVDDDTAGDDASAKKTSGSTSDD
ncbi:aquaporin Z [Myceligenerans cantabricum]